MKKSILFILIMMGVNGWSQNIWEQTNSPEGSQVLNLVKSPQGYLYASTTGGIFRSENDGDSWERLQLNSLHPLMAINSQGDIFAIDEGQIYRTLDGGDTWDAVLTVDSSFTSIAISPQGIIYAAHLGSNDGEVSVYKSIDNGDTWLQKLTNTGYYGHLYLSVNSSGNVFARSGNGGIYRSIDEGETWIKLTSLDSIEQQYVRRIVFNSEGDIFIGFHYGNWLYRSEDNGESWTRVFKADNIFPLACNSTDDIFVSSDHGLFLLKDGGTIWSQIDLGMPKQIIEALYVDSLNNIHAGANGVFRSYDNGENWLAISNGIQASTITSITESSQGNLFIISDAIYRSQDNSSSWTKIKEIEPTETTLMRVHPNGDIYVATYRGLYRSTDAGETWQVLLYMLVNNIVFNSEGDIFISKDGGILRSTDNGVSWTLENNGLGCIDFINSLLLSESGTMYITGCDNRIYTSTDNAENWMSTGFIESGTIIAVNSQDHLFSIQGSEVLVSTDNGFTWQVIYTEPDPYTSIRHLVTDSFDNLYLTLSYKGVYRSTDNGESWALFNEGLDYLDMKSIFFSSTGYLYAGPLGSGMWRINLQEAPVNAIARNQDIYPNPAIDIVTITSGRYSEEFNDFISIYNLHGKLLKRIPVTKQAMAIDVTDLPRGMYVINNSVSKESKKLILQ